MYGNGDISGKIHCVTMAQVCGLVAKLQLACAFQCCDRMIIVCRPTLWHIPVENQHHLCVNT